jgi:hypothetical protein
LTLHADVKQVQVRLDDPQRFTEYQLKMRDYVPPEVSLSKHALGLDCASLNAEWRRNRRG